MSRFANKSVVVTGGAQGLGRAIAKAFVDEGATVVICDFNASLLQDAVAALGPTAHSIVADITNTQQVKAVVDLAVSKTGRLDVWINNAGVMDRFEPVGSVARETWDRVVGINLTGTFICLDEAVKAMLAQSPAGGAILNVASAASVRGGAAGAAYTASKHGVIGLTKNTAAFLGKKGIRCNAILPGGMATSIVDPNGGLNMEFMAVLRSTMAMEPPMNKLEDVAKFVLALSEDGPLNGACVPVDGGWAAY
ncbi:unnamed protein product [Mycena citricolor]|uniref:Ketoreductase domain-containing protein n=1 Tax=Mycena citricolor TaxID=2018698 RepID=A0AAD2H167_9AGAR|nr:unnamed protein product [Mycena citricolor]CAK5268034.1 unnamed protein product [Mycena citricolor]